MRRGTLTGYLAGDMAKDANPLGGYQLGGYRPGLHGLRSRQATGWRDFQREAAVVRAEILAREAAAAPRVIDRLTSQKGPS